jgi:RNA polymerase sigma factor (sigma-70 family)
VNEQIVELIKAQKDEGLKLLHRQYAGLMRYIVGNILQSPEDTEECLSDIYIKVWSSIASYSPEKSKFSTWLTVIARNAALNYLKRHHQTHEKLPEEAADGSSLEEEVLRRERAEELKQAIDSLSAEEQHLFYRKYYYLQKTAQIAAELGMTERAVEGKLYRLRKKLQQQLGGEGR